MHRDPVDERVESLGLVPDVQLGASLSSGTKHLDRLAAEIAHVGVRLIS